MVWDNSVVQKRRLDGDKGFQLFDKGGSLCDDVGDSDKGFDLEL